MTKEERLKEIMSCDCRDVYKEREMADPHCCYCNHKDDILQAMESYAQSPTKELQDKVKQLEGEVVRLKELAMKQWVTNSRFQKTGNKEMGWIKFKAANNL